MLSVGGLFSGIGGIELGLERAGMRVLWHCEQDPYARGVLEQHWPGVPCYDDVRTLRGADIEPVDVLWGGFPCQDISIAGAGVGIDGARSGLWSEYARLVGELRPRYVVVENVAALLGRGLGRVLGDLAAFGYDAEWDCIPASAVGAPHERDRLWLVAYAEGSGRDRRAGRDSEPLARGERPSGVDLDRYRLRDHAGDKSSVADAECAGPQGRSGGGLTRAGRTSGVPAGFGEGHGWQWEPEPDVGRVATRIPARVDRLRCLGNSVVPQIPEWIGTRILEWEGGLT